MLAEVLSKLPPQTTCPALLVGYETGDDAGVRAVNDELAVMATTDFFAPIVDDPHDFGRIAAANALSDVYAMGGTPIMALAIANEMRVHNWENRFIPGGLKRSGQF